MNAVKYLLRKKEYGLKNKIENIAVFTQRNNRFNPSVACFPTSSAIALHYKGVEDPINNMQLEDYLVYLALNLTQEEKQVLVSVNGQWILNHRPFQVIPIMEYVCRKLYGNTKMSWKITFEDIVKNIDNNNPVVCLGNFSSISYVKGHYNCIIGYDTEKRTVITHDPFGNAHTNYKDFNGENMEYDWKIFHYDGNNFSCGLLF